MSVFFGFTSPDDDAGPAGIELLVPRFAMQVVVGLAFALILAVIVVVVFGWSSSPWLGLAIGAVAFGVLEYVSDVRGGLPKGAVPDLPADAAITSWRADGGAALKRLAVMTAVIVPFLFLMDAVAPGELWFIAPGQPVGMAIAVTVGAVRARRWERADGRRLAARVSPNGILALYAIPRGRVSP